MREVFGDFGIADGEAFYRAVNRVRMRGYIRTEADEVHYNLHVMMRFDLERALIRGDLGGDLEAAWNDRFRADFGVQVDRLRTGCCRMCTGRCGLFGYFPTYTLGNVYAGCLVKALRAEVPGLDGMMAKGDVSGRDGLAARTAATARRRYLPREVVTRACGHEPSEGPLLDYLEAKFGEIYGL
jgi:carboxypeptidase Taq